MAVINKITTGSIPTSTTEEGYLGSEGPKKTGAESANFSRRQDGDWDVKLDDTLVSILEALGYVFRT